MIFGGFAQFFVTWLIEATGSPIAPYSLSFGPTFDDLARPSARNRGDRENTIRHGSCVSLLAQLYRLKIR
jgi:hypothetical protein